MVSTLKQKCLLLLSNNNILQNITPILKNLPHSLLLDLCLYLSPYGLQIIQDNTDIPAKKFSMFWLRVNDVPSSYAIKCRRHKQIKLTSCRPSSQHDFTTNQEFYYNALLFSIIDGIHSHDWRSNFNSCFEIAWSNYLRRPTLGHPIVYFTPPEEDRVELSCSLFLKTLARYVTELPVTFTSSEALMTHRDVFTPILCNVCKLSLNLNKTPSQTTEHIVEVLQLILNENTCVSSLRVQFKNTHGSRESNFEKIWNIIHNAVFVSNQNFDPDHGLFQDTEMDLEPQQQDQQYELETFRSDSIDETIASHYEPYKKRVKSSVHCRHEEDLYECVFEPLSNVDRYGNAIVGGPSIENRIFFLKLNFSYNAEKIFQTLSTSISLWKNLRCLILNFNGNVEFDYFSSVVDNLVCFGNLRELVLFGLDCKPHHEQSIVNAASPKFCPQHTNTNEGNYSQLESLSLYSCSFSTTMLVDILKEFKWCDHLDKKKPVLKNDECDRHIVSYEREHGQVIGEQNSELIENRENREKSSSYCYFRGLTSLHVTVDDLYDDIDGNDDIDGDDDLLLPSILCRNLYLEELRIVLNYVDESSFSMLLRSMKSHENLTTLDVSTVYTRMTPDQSDLSGVLTGNTLTQLCLTSCFAEGIPPSIFDGDFTKSRLVTLIWSNNFLGNKGLDCISKKLADRQQLPHLQNLDLSSNLFDIDAVTRFTGSLEIRCRRPFQKLALCGKNVSSVDLKKRGLWNKLNEHCCYFVTTFTLNTDMSDFASVM